MITVLGGSGFIGSNLIRHLESLEIEHAAPSRGSQLEGALGHVIYCIGKTADFREQPFETIAAHVTRFADVLRTCEFESLLYLSSIRVYQRAASGNETAELVIDPTQAEDLYNVSKLMGESIALASDRKVRVARLGNVYGSDFVSKSFVSSVLNEALATGRVTLQSSLESARDYISVDAVCSVLREIALHGRERLYNVASGRLVTNSQILDRVQELTGCSIEVASDEPPLVPPVIDITRAQSEFGLASSDLLADLPALVESYRVHLAKA